MALVLNPLEGTEKDLENQGQNANNNQPLQEKTLGGGESSGNIGQGSAGQSLAQAKPAASVSQRAPSSSGQFTNIQKYIKANQNYKGQGLGGELASRISGTAGQARNLLDQNKQALNQNVQKAIDSSVKTPQFEQAIQRVRDNGDVEGDRDVLGKGVKQEYTGPTQFENLTQLNATGRDLSQLGRQTENEAGRQALLQRYFNRPTYNQGQQMLDTLLLSDQNQLGKLGGARKNALTFTPGLNKESEAASAQANAAKNEINATRKRAEELANQAIEGETGELDEAVKKVNEDYQNKINQYMKDINYNKSDLSDIQDVYDYLGGNVNNADIINQYGRAKDLATISRSNADPRQAALVNYFTNLMGGGDLVQGIEEGVPDAAKATFYVDNQARDIAQTARQLEAQYEAARRAQVDAHNRYYQAAAQSGNLGQVDWETADLVGAANNNAYAIENQLRDLRQRLTGNTNTAGFYGGQMARDTAAEMDRAKQNALQIIAQRNAQNSGGGGKYAHMANNQVGVGRDPADGRYYTFDRGSGQKLQYLGY